MRNPVAEQKKIELLSRHLPYDIPIRDMVFSIESYDVYPPGSIAKETCDLVDKGSLNFLDKKVLDLGCGSGVMSVIAARNGAKKVLALDILQDCVQSTCKNARLNQVADKIDARVSNALDALTPDDLFDMIIFIAPQDDSEPNEGLDHAFYDFGFNMLRSFSKDAPNYLLPNGSIILAFMDHNMERMPIDQLFPNSISRVLARIGSDLSLVEISYTL